MRQKASAVSQGRARLPEHLLRRCIPELASGAGRARCGCIIETALNGAASETPRLMPAPFGGLARLAVDSQPDP